ncbi:glycine cleavage system protein GcvH [Alicyclobacillus sendaiensis]|uniref:glycine cleavage system protein GcvH n=1 Tax=Alicyclobacillus sendaiensis TaxID=192387 RepID=UPI00078324AA|nr:glycine cleavage system protein GcvH [Alicyclobacillus sendaiensis]
MNIPEGLKYSREHEWVRVDGSRAYIGITDYAQDELGDIVYVELPEVGTELRAGETFGTVESVKTVSDLYAPVSGRVVQVNEALSNAPEKVNESPYEEAWMIVVEMENTSELEALLDAESYRQHIQS